MSPSLASRRALRRPALEAKIHHMTLPLSPLVQINTGSIHPSFPSTMLQFWLLTSEQLDDLAHFYHQRTPGLWSQHYPCPVRWSQGLGLEEKRRKLGKFIGLRDCETPLPIDAAYSAVSSVPLIVEQAPYCKGCCPTDWSAVWSSPATTMRKAFCLACASAAARRQNQKTAMEMSAARAMVRSDPNEAKLPRSRVKRTTGYASRPRRAVGQARLSRPSRPPASYRHRGLRQELTVEDVVEEASRARLAGDASEQALRNKMGYYR